MEMVRTEGARQVARTIEYYNLDAIIAVGYRVNSYQATQFRIWATRTLREFMLKGFVLDDERLKQGNAYFGKDYFNDLLERIREIRASERRHGTPRARDHVRFGSTSSQASSSGAQTWSQNISLRCGMPS